MDRTGPAHEQTVTARGHRHVTARHGSTFEVTTDDALTPSGDCILAVGADRAAADLDPTFVEACRDPTATITATIRAGGRAATVTGRGHQDLTFADERSLVGRTSTYVDDRTVLVGADSAAGDLPRRLVEALASGGPVTLTLAVE